MVLEITQASGVEIIYGVKVEDVDEEEPSVKLADGRVIRADLIVGADGMNSIVREKIVGEPWTPEYGTFSNFS